MCEYNYYTSALHQVVETHCHKCSVLVSMDIQQDPGVQFIMS